MRIGARVSGSANLTSDPNTGIGQDLCGTSRPILPPMPWPAFRNLSDEDLKAIFAFLRTVPPINNHVPDPILAEAAVALAR